MGLTLDTNPNALEGETAEEQMERKDARIKELEELLAAKQRDAVTSSHVFRFLDGATGDESMGLIGERNKKRKAAAAKTDANKAATKTKLAERKRRGEEVFQALQNRKTTLLEFKGKSGEANLKGLLTYAGISYTNVSKIDALRDLAAGAVVDLEKRPPIDLGLRAPKQAPAQPRRAEEEEMEEVVEDEEEEEEEEPEYDDDSDADASDSESMDEDELAAEAARVTATLPHNRQRR